MNYIPLNELTVMPEQQNPTNLKDFARAATLFIALGFGPDRSLAQGVPYSGKSGFKKGSREIAELNLPLPTFLKEIGTFAIGHDYGGLEYRKYDTLYLDRVGKPNQALSLPTPGTGNNALIKRGYLEALYNHYLALSVDERALLIEWIRTDPFYYTIPLY